LFFIFKEGLQNAVRHARASEVWIGLKSANRGVALTIADDGIGLPDNENPPGSGNGLQYMKLRASSVAGTFQLKSEKGKGTVVRVEIPVAFAPRLPMLRDLIVPPRTHKTRRPT